MSLPYGAQKHMAPFSSQSQTTVILSMSQVEVTEKTEGVEKNTAVEARTSGVQAEGFDYNYKLLSAQFFYIHWFNLECHH